jgi:hypothetical protein
MARLVRCSSFSSIMGRVLPVSGRWPVATNDMKSKQWVAPNAGTKYRVLCDPSIATGIYREDGSMVTHVEVGSESEILASRRLATGVRDKCLKHHGIALEGGVGILPNPLKIALKIINPVKSFGKLLLQRFKCGRVHNGSSNSSTNAEVSRTDGEKRL